MKPFQLGFGVALAVIVGLNPSGRYAVGEEGLLHFQTDAKGVILKVEIPHKGVHWKDMETVMSIANRSLKEITYYDPGPLGGFRFSMATEKKDKLRLTDKGKVQLQDLSRVEVWKYATMKMPPNSQITVKAMLSDYFVLEKPGVYNLSVTWQSDPAHIDPERNIRIELRDMQFTVANLK